MPRPTRPAQPGHDYDAIEATVSASEAGRAFLAEYARRSRTDETRRLLEAVAGLEAAMAEPNGAVAAPPPVQADLGDAVARVRAAIGGAHGGVTPAGALGDLARALARILDAAERLQELGWTVRERGFDAPLCDSLDALSTEIHAGCGLHESAVHSLVEQVGALDEIAAALRLTRV